MSERSVDRIEELTAEVERLKDRIADLELELAQENASSRVYMDKTDAEIAALTKALKGAVVILEFSGNYIRMTDEDHALCERLFGGGK